MKRTMFGGIVILMVFLTEGCKEEVEKQTIYSEGGKEAITVLHFGDKNKTYLINERYEYDTVPQNYILNNHYFLDSFIGLVEWMDSTTVIYTQYGEFETYNASDDFHVKQISTKEFEEKKKDTVRYKYFYH